MAFGPRAALHVHRAAQRRKRVARVIEATMSTPSPKPDHSDYVAKLNTAITNNKKGRK